MFVREIIMYNLDKNDVFWEFGWRSEVYTRKLVLFKYISVNNHIQIVQTQVLTTFKVLTLSVTSSVKKGHLSCRRFRDFGFSREFWDFNYK